MTMPNDFSSRDELNSRLSLAAMLGDASALILLLSQGADPKAEDSEALFFAASHGHASCVELLIPFSDPTANESYALGRAARNGHAKCVELLTPFPHSKDAMGFALVRASESGSADCIRLLLSQPFSMDEASRSIHFAARNGHAECVKILLPASDPAADHSDALNEAASNGYAECVALLLSPTALVKNPRPFYSAIDAGHASVVALMLASEPSLAELVDFDQACSHAVALGRHELAATLLSFSESRSISASADVAAGSLRPMPSPRL